MEEVNAFLVKQKLGILNKFVIGFQSLDEQFKLKILNHQIYVPEHFVFGNFKKRKDGFIFQKIGVFYRDSAEVLQEYQGYIDDEKLEVVKSLLLPDSVLESIAKQSKIYLDIRKQIGDSANSLDKYFL